MALSFPVLERKRGIRWKVSCKGEVVAPNLPFTQFFKYFVHPHLPCLIQGVWKRRRKRSGSRGKWAKRWVLTINLLLEATISVGVYVTPMDMVP